MAKRKNGMPRSVAFGIGRPVTAEDLDVEKQEKAARKARIEYVNSCAFGGPRPSGLPPVSPFLDYNWDTAARKYIETGDESLKSQFPGPRKEQSK